MAVTVAQVTHVNGGVWFGDFLGYKAQVVDVTFDASYDNTNGEVINASDVGFDTIVGAIVLVHPYDSANDLASVVVPVVPAAQTSVALRIFEADGSAAGQAPLDESANTTDYSAYTARVVILGA